MPGGALERLHALHGLWLSRRNGRAMPSRADLRAEDLREWIGHILIAEVEKSPRRYRLRLIGTVINEYDGADFTGRYLDEVLSPVVRNKILAQYDNCATTARPAAFTCQGVDGRGGPAGIAKLFLPFSTDGSTVDQIMVCLYAECGYRQGLVRQTIQDLETGVGTRELDAGELILAAEQRPFP